MPKKWFQARAVTSLIPLLFVITLEQAPGAYTGDTESALSRGRVSVVDTGEYVVSLDTKGAHSGMVTLRFSVNADGSIGSGWFGAVVAYAETLNADGTVDHEAHAEEPESSEPHTDRMRLVNRGTVSGSITAGRVGRSATGALTLSGVVLAVESGSLEFDGASGWGTVEADLTDADAQGTLRLVTEGQ